MKQKLQRTGVALGCCALSAFAALGLGVRAAPASRPQSKAATSKALQQLPKHYSDWLNRDVVYIITRQERGDFLKLTTDDARDRFIQHFWDIRNPTPGSPINTYKDSIYERITYANDHFAIGSGEEGWRTDRGRTYITIGKPQQIQRYLGAPNLRPIEMWFYGNVSPALPNFFYILFYQRDNIGDFRFYSPSLDGPTELVTGTEAIGNQSAALRMIQESVGAELERVAQTLIPGEPLDPNGRIGLQSDMLLADLRNLANQPANIAELERRSELTQSVTSRLIVDASNLDIVLLPVKDARGLSRLDYAVRLRNAEDLTVTKTDDGRYSYAVEVRVQVSAPDKTPIFTQQKNVTGSMDKSHLDEVASRPFGYEGTLPLPAGKYHLDFLVTDWSKKTGFHAERDVTIPATASDAFAIPAVLPFSRAQAVDPSKDGLVPFAMAGVRFTPLETTPVLLNPDQPLNVAYQIWAPAQDPKTMAGQNLAVDYALGRPGLSSESATVINDNVDMGQFSAAGSLVNGKKISLSDKPAGNYLLTISVSHAGPNPGHAEKAFVSLPFELSGTMPSVSPWDVDEPDIEADQAKGIIDQQRALSYLAQGDATQARLWFRAALSKNHDDDVARAHLIEAYYGLNAYSSVVSVYDDAGITDRTDPATISEIAESLLSTGDPSKGASLLQTALKSFPEDATLYLAMADCDRQLGKAQEALEMASKGKSLLGDSTSKP